MILRSCFDCKFHEIRDHDSGQKSRCGRENCWSEFSRCIDQRALDHFLKQDCVAPGEPFAAPEHAPVAPDQKA
jgi:hypothetical protein